MLARAAFAVDHKWSDLIRLAQQRRVSCKCCKYASMQVCKVKCSPPSLSPSPSWDLIIHTAGDCHLTRSTSPSPSFRESHGLCCGAMPGTSLTQGCPRSPSAAPPRPAPSLSEIPWPLIGWRSYSRGDDAVVRVDEGASASIYSTPPLPLQRGRPTLHTKATPHSRPSSAITRGTPS